MPRVSIYVTKDLKQKMDQRPDLNWSRIASEALAVELAGGAPPMPDVDRKLQARIMAIISEYRSSLHNDKT